MPPRFRSRNDQQKHHISKLGSKSKGNYSISDTQKLLKNEKGVNKRKVDVSVHKVLFSESFIHLMKAVLLTDLIPFFKGPSQVRRMKLFCRNEMSIVKEISFLLY